MPYTKNPVLPKSSTLTVYNDSTNTMPTKTYLYYFSKNGVSTKKVCVDIAMGSDHLAKVNREEIFDNCQDLPRLERLRGVCID